jgi:hypothetical protein
MDLLKSSAVSVPKRAVDHVYEKLEYDHEKCARWLNVETERLKIGVIAFGIRSSLQTPNAKNCKNCRFHDLGDDAGKVYCPVLDADINGPRSVVCDVWELE